MPWLIAAASVVLLLQPRIRVAAERRTAGRDGRAHLSTSVGLFAVAVYGGYFGAAAGVLMLAVLLVGLPVSLLDGNALKNVLLGLANTTAALGFAVVGPVDWAAVAPLAVGLFAGARLGPALARRLPAPALRVGIGVAGLGLAAAIGLGLF